MNNKSKLVESQHRFWLASFNLLPLYLFFISCTFTHALLAQWAVMACLPAPFFFSFSWTASVKMELSVICRLAESREAQRSLSVKDPNNDFFCGAGRAACVEVPVDTALGVSFKKVSLEGRTQMMSR